MPKSGWIVECAKCRSLLEYSTRNTPSGDVEISITPCPNCVKDNGYGDGHYDGYGEGYSDGHTDGWDEGYAAGREEYE